MAVAPTLLDGPTKLRTRVGVDVVFVVLVRVGVGEVDAAPSVADVGVGVGVGRLANDATIELPTTRVGVRVGTLDVYDDGVAAACVRC